MKILYVMMGIPGSGKSTYARKLDAKYVSLDKIREEKFGDINYRGEESTKIWTEACSMIIQASRHGENAVLDATNVLRSGRRKIIRQFRQNFDKFVLCYVKTPLSVAIERNNNRENVLEEYIIRDKYEKLVEPQLDEGWDEILYI